MNIGKKITNFYCNGFFGRRYDLTDSIIEGEGEDWVVIRLPDKEVGVAIFSSSEEKNEYINDWT